MILKKIINEKRKEVQERKRLCPIAKEELLISERDFKAAIAMPFGLIAEIKRGSPSEGVIIENLDLNRISSVYEKNKHIRAISVLTDSKFFFMDLHYLPKIRDLTTKPILRKDFIIDEYQVYESRLNGADAILLIASVLGRAKINRFIALARRYNMDCLVEVHSSEELDKVLLTKAEIIGINNRNLDTLEVDLNTTIELASRIPEDKIIVTESGYHSSEELNKVKNKVNAALIGTSILKSKNIDYMINKLMK